MEKTGIVVTVGGGSGMPVVNRGLLRAGFRNVHAIVTTFDSGGDTGRMRTDERGRILAFSDYWRALMSLWDDGEHKRQWEEMLRFRDGRGRNFGNTFFQFMSERTGDLSSVDGLFSKLTGAELHGKVIPVAISPAHICFTTLSGKVYHGEHHLDDLRMSLDRVVRIWLEPRVQANPEAIESLRQAQMIIVCPGSMYGSVLTNFLPRGMVRAYLESPARKVLMTNIMSVANENNNYTQDDYARVFGQYLDTDHPFDLAVMPDLDALDPHLMEKAYSLYSLEHSSPIRASTSSALPTMIADIALIERQNLRLRHCEVKLGQMLTDLAL